ncbi:LysR family transcriptional regulator [Skermanella stibiiresistens SB22]|uniref:LysR family transcriptional regulator n=1 Tax=Skermanella stibiiresistens SB22 TaxID=1385369 RepID=W9GWT4_9PROT|nr:LysR family transcriptional regulator [Skermanella stibiiresistens]EWY36912.1 LysR family transcriptional regulator [Skermanella stibiiresistens SB22]
MLFHDTAIKERITNGLFLRVVTMHDLDALQIFARVAEMASFTKAAKSLGIHKGRVSTTVRQLEVDVGAALLHRTTRAVQLTEDGRAFYTRARDLLADAEDLRSMFASEHTSLRGRLRVDLPTELARSTLIPAIPQFMAANPELELEISSTDRRVDLVQEGFDCVVRIGPVVDETLIARPIGALRMVNAASPAYLARRGTPHTLEDLVSQGHATVHYTPTLGSKPFGWEYPDGDGYSSLALPGALSVNSVQAYHAAGVAGVGLVQAGLAAMSPYFESGEMVRILPDLPPEPLQVWFVVAHRRNMSRRVRALMSWIETTMAPYLDGSSSPRASI